jgi:hypothetical protein
MIDLKKHVETYGAYFDTAGADVLAEPMVDYRTKAIEQLYEGIERMYEDIASIGIDPRCYGYCIDYEPLCIKARLIFIGYDHLFRRNA